MNKKTLNLLGQLLLLIATLIWGTSFFILKETITAVPTFYVLLLRFIPSGIILLLVFSKKTFKMGKGTFKRGIILGLILSGAYVTQTLGLTLTTPARNAFVTSSYVVMIPFLVWALKKAPPKSYNVITAITCLIGIGFVSFSNGFGSAQNTAIFGDLLTFVAAIFYAFQIYFITEFQDKNDDPISLLSIELLTVGAICLIISLVFELPLTITNGTLNSFHLSGDQLIKIGYLTLACTLLAQAFQMFGQRYTTTNQASIILSLESVFGAFFSVLFAGEVLNVIMIIGFIIVFTSVIVNELEIDFIKLLNGKKGVKK